MKTLTALALLCIAASTAQAQIQITLQPSSDISHTAAVGFPNTTSFYPNLDDLPVGTSDGDSSFVRSNNTTGNYTCGFSGARAGTVSKVVVNYFACRKSTAGTIQALLYNGATLLASGTVNTLGSSYVQYTDTFTGLNVSSANNLQVELKFSNPSGADSLRCSSLWIVATVMPKLVFVINTAYVTGVQGVASPNGSALASHFFSNSNSIIFTNSPSTNPIPSGYTALGGMKFPGYGSTISGDHAFQPTLNAGQIDSHVSVVIYDNEYWGNSGATPTAEMANPSSYTAQFATLAHNNHYSFMSTPSRDLAEGQSNYPGMGTLDDYYFTVDKVPAWVASAPADIFGVQMQVHTTDGTYASSISNATSQAVGVDPEIQIIAVLSTNYGTATDMYNAVINTYQTGNVVGYFINVSGGNYQEVADFLNMLETAGF